MTTPISERRLANAIRTLAFEAVQKANSGHPGAPMGMADIAEVLWRKFLKHNPTDPNWLNRDRFVLSNIFANCTLKHPVTLNMATPQVWKLPQVRWVKGLPML